MIIQRIEIISFGKFKNKIMNFTDGLNIIYGDNESGKSTVISFIYAMLYGFGDNRGKTLSLREKYTPWNGEACEGKLFVTTDDGKSITIYRKAGNAKKYDILQIYDTKTAEELSLLPEEIVGVGSDTFFKTLCVKQLSTTLSGSNDEIAQKLSNLAAGGDENSSFEKAQKLLEGVRREIQPHRGSLGALAQISRQIADAEKNLDANRNAASELDTLLRLLPKEEKAAAALKKEYEELLKEDYSSSIARLEGRLEEMQKNGRKAFPVYILFPLLAAFILTLFISIRYSLIFLALFLAACIPVFFKRKPSADSDMGHLQKEIERLRSEKENHETELAILKERLTACENKLTQMKIREHALRSSSHNCEDNTQELYKKKQILEKRLQTVTLASQALASAYENMQKNFTPALNRKASEYFSVICGGKYNRIFCNENFGIKIDNDIPRDSSFFSGGTVDQLYLSLRLALIDMLFKEKSCAIILDQPFLQYDDSRRKNTVELLEALQNNRQTLLFTADKSVNSPNKPTEILT